MIYLLYKAFSFHTKEYIKDINRNQIEALNSEVKD